MSDVTPTPCPEIVGIFRTREMFDKAVAALEDAGFGHADLSILTSHASIDAANAPEDRSLGETLRALVTESRFEVPLVASGLIALSTGPTAAAIAALIGAGMSGVAVKDFMDKITSTPDTDDFARAIHAGEIVLWVAAETPGTQQKAREILEKFEARNVHLHTEETE